MDEILHAPQMNHPVRTPRRDHASRARQVEAPAKAKGSFAQFVAAAGAYGRLLQVQGTRVFHRAQSAAAGKKRMGPLPFLALSAALGIASVVTTVYTPSYVVTVNGVDLGLVQDQAVFEQVENRVETRASSILGYDYQLQGEVSYSFALSEQENLTPISHFETYLFDQIGEVMKSYVLTVDGQFIGAATDRAALDGLLSELSAPYVTESTVATDFMENVHITREYTPSDVEQDVPDMLAVLTANTSGQTTYEIQKGDTFMQLAMDNGMTMEELQSLNPNVDVDKLMIGQILNVKEVIPYLSVKTVDALAYQESIECTVREVKDDSMYQGDSKVLDPGIPGLQAVSAEVTYVNGKELERNITETTVLQEATEKVIAVGTKVRPTWMPNGYFIWPVYGRVTSSFGYRSIFGTYSYHSGLDIAVPYGTSVKAADGGTVTFSGYKGSYGNLVIIDHGNGKQTYYGHNSTLSVSAGDKVYQGQVIAGAGSTGRSTGSHCHFEVKINGTSVNPRAYLG